MIEHKKKSTSNQPEHVGPASKRDLLHDQSGRGDWYRIYAATVHGSAHLLAAGLGGRIQEALEEIDTWNIGSFTSLSSFYPKNWGRCVFSKNYTRHVLLENGLKQPPPS